MTKTIKFFPQEKALEDWFEEPIPAKKMIPEWYKQQSNYVGGTKTMQGSGLFNSTIKACMPVFDVITAGYIIKLPVDLYIEVDRTVNAPKISWSIDDYKPIEEHSRLQFDKFNLQKEYYETAYKFMNNWMVKTPKGYSSLFVTPFLRDDLPFYCLPAIVDTDKHPLAVNFPFFLRKDFEGIIYKDTPIIQVIPFKRDSWNHETNKYDHNNTLIWKRAQGTIENRYKKYFRSIKQW